MVCGGARNINRRRVLMDIRVGDRLLMKKPHPCGGREFRVMRAGMDFRIKCEKCGHEILTPRSKIEKSIKQVIMLPRD